ncbi:SLOG family protein [Streptomyces scabiei]|uniref:SLOG family protein n=1 Tax=Streptomyces scabiei TaxID=1930 RepID=UPI0007659A05|nr:SLOG family protein [Streptomyces scabiei]MDX2658323.1 SLOG family protein [Streptomyces scabiei]MDX2870608.1 SLOG family protein [Streptomyces scabiei]MDX2999537.1 SLOG family protein [Streptomyces scabiei]MDX3053003.1 SLOG family protein [Streptomyces scabiei]MDX3175289.1 SLOG family protein [Streptomyces scabiei]
MTTAAPHLALILVTGSRTWPDPRLLEDTLLDVWHDALQDGWDGIEVMHGHADHGADAIADAWAIRHAVPYRRRPADWPGPCAATCPPGHRRINSRGRPYCPLAGHRRNQAMVDEQPLLVVAASHNRSTGTADCMRRAKAADIPVHLITV